MEFNFGRSLVSDPRVEHLSQSQSQNSQSLSQYSQYPVVNNNNPNFSIAPIGNAPNSAPTTSNFGAFSRAISSQESNRIPVTISQSSTTTGSSMVLAEEAPSNLDVYRNQSRFQEFIARSRHMEVMETLHDVKKRLIALEDRVGIQHTLAMQGINGVNREAETNTNAIAESLNQIYTSSTSSLKDLTTTVCQCKEQLNHLQMDVTKNDRVIVHNHCPQDKPFWNKYINHESEEDEGVPLKDYLSNKNFGRRDNSNRKIAVDEERKIKYKIMEGTDKGRITQSSWEPLYEDDPDLDPIAYTKFDGFGMVEEPYGNNDTYVVDSFMTDPIIFK